MGNDNSKIILISREIICSSKSNVELFDYDYVLFSFTFAFVVLKTFYDIDASFKIKITKSKNQIQK